MRHCSRAADAAGSEEDLTTAMRFNSFTSLTDMVKVAKIQSWTSHCRGSNSFERSVGLKYIHL